MLKNEVESVDLPAIRNDLLSKIPGLLEQIEAQHLDDETLNINYPVLKYPSKIVSLNLDKAPIVSGVLEGIKGQYLLLDSGVLNLRKFSSYHVELSV